MIHDELAEEEKSRLVTRLPTDADDKVLNTCFAVDRTIVETAREIADDLSRRTEPGSLTQAKAEQDTLLRKAAFLATGAYSLEPILQSREWLVEAPRRKAEDAIRMEISQERLRTKDILKFMDELDAPVTAGAVQYQGATRYEELQRQEERNRVLWRQRETYLRHPHQVALERAGHRVGLQMLREVDRIHNGGEATAENLQAIREDAATAVFIQQLAGDTGFQHLTREDLELP